MFGDKKIMPELTEEFLKNAAFKALQNPIYHGEALNALSYPDQFYQKNSRSKVMVKRRALHKADAVSYDKSCYRLS